MEMPAQAQRTTQAFETNVHTIRAILELPDKEIDLAKAKLTIDYMIDPKIDIANNLKHLDVMVAEIKARLPSDASSRDKLEFTGVPVSSWPVE